MVLEARTSPTEAKLQQAVDKTLEKVAKEYFPVSRMWELRRHPSPKTNHRGGPSWTASLSSTGEDVVPQQQKTVPRGSMTVVRGQNTAWRRRQANQLVHVTNLRQFCVLDKQRMQKISNEVAAFSGGDRDPFLSFARFMRVLESVGMTGDSQSRLKSEGDFYRRMYKSVAGLQLDDCGVPFLKSRQYAGRCRGHRRRPCLCASQNGVWRSQWRNVHPAELEGPCVQFPGGKRCFPLLSAVLIKSRTWCQWPPPQCHAPPLLLLPPLCRIVDVDSDDNVSFHELLQGLACLTGGSAREKLEMFYLM